MWFYISVRPKSSSPGPEVAVVDKEKGKVIFPIMGSWGWALGHDPIPFHNANLFENKYRDAIQLLFRSERMIKRYARSLAIRREKEARERSHQLAMQDLERYRQIVEK